MVGSCSRDGGSVKTASIGGDTFQGLVVMHASSPAKSGNFFYERNISSVICGSDNSTQEKPMVQSHLTQHSLAQCDFNSTQLKIIKYHHH